MNAALLCCLLFIFIFFFLVLRKDILTIENVKAEAEEEPCGGLEASVKLCVGPGSGLTPGQVLQERGLSGVNLRTLHARKAPLCLWVQRADPTVSPGLFPSLSLPLWLRVSLP